MKNFRIYFGRGQREQILNLLHKYSDILINNVTDESVGLTIESEDADDRYRRIVSQISFNSLRPAGS